MNFKVGDLITHNCGYKAIVLELGENVARICVFYHPEWGKGRLENWLFDDRVHHHNDGMGQAHKRGSKWTLR